jgi:hypothetical protein
MAGESLHVLHKLGLEVAAETKEAGVVEEIPELELVVDETGSFADMMTTGTSVNV